MLPNIDFTSTEAYRKLVARYEILKDKNIKDLFQEDPYRFEKYSVMLDDLLFDYSKNRLDEETFSLLIQLAQECRMEEAIDAMFSGKKINVTEGRPVLHTALRNQASHPIYVDGERSEERRVGKECRA